MHSLILAWASLLLGFMLPMQHAELSFYGEEVELTYPAELFANGNLQVTGDGIDLYLLSASSRDWDQLHSQLDAYRVKWELNDWLYFKLVHQTLDEIAGFVSTSEQRVLEHHLLSLAGYDTRLCYDQRKGDIFIYVYTDEAMFEVPIIEDENRKYVNLSAALLPRKHHSRSLNMHPRRPNPAGEAFSFSLIDLPNLTPQLVERPYFFTYQGEAQTIRTSSDRTIIQWMEDYPFFEEGLYMEIPMSDAAGDQLYGQLRTLLEGKSEAESLSYLAAFTRGAFDYKEDKKAFGYSKPMIAEETLFYAQSDCEDRSALYFNLVKELLDVPIIAIAYNDHLSVAVASKELKGKAYWHDGKRYRVCDPTGPSGSSEVGNPPHGYANRRFEVVASYDPEVLAKAKKQDN
ncbi:MAG: hypothetical protein AB8F78_13905 [Saprospiraceae bacterium]